MIRRCRLLALALAFGGLSACVAQPLSPSAAIAQFVAGENDGFASQRGAFRGADHGLQYYETALTLPGASKCAVYTTSSGAYAFGTCDFLASNVDDARRIYDAWKQNTVAAEPDWKTREPRPPLDGRVATFQAADDAKHAIYLYVAKAKGMYRVTETFATTDAFQAH
jgi:hypothetical protein